MSIEKKLIAYMNNGRWIFHCPRCDVPLPAQEKGVVCPQCWPAIGSRAFKQLPGGLLRPVPDMELIERARTQARNADEIWVPVFPPEKQQIEEILRLRPRPANMNWVPGETLEMLCEQNIEHGDPVPNEK